MKRKYAIVTLLLAAALLWIFRDLTYGVSFILQLGALACAGTAFLLFLRLPFRNPRLRKAARRLFSLLLVLLVLGGLSFVWIEGLIFRNAGGRPCEDADLLVVLGAGLNGSTPSAVLTSRLQVTLEYLQSHPDAIAILTGSQGSDESCTEASAMARWLTDRGIDPRRLLLEEKAHNTAQNIKYSVRLMAEQGLDDRTVMVVSNEFHLYRARKIFARYDRTVCALPAPTPRIGLVPLNSYVREYFSIVVMYAKDLLGYDE